MSDPQRISSGSPVGLAAVLVVITAMTLWWRIGVFRARAKPSGVTDGAWEQVKEAYPLPHDHTRSPTFSRASAGAVMEANPFSPQRRAVPPTSGGGGEEEPGIIIEPPRPKFTFKGQITVGKQLRGIVEDTNTGKTLFLEVGQEVAGLKVLDISQRQVVLWDPSTQEELVVTLPLAGPSKDREGNEPGTANQP